MEYRIQKHLSLLLQTALLTSGCAFVPETSETQPYADDCSLFTKRQKLSMVISDTGCGSSSDAAACLVVAYAALPVVTFVVSGSYVLIANSCNWLEYQGRCESSPFYTYIDKMTGSNRAVPESDEEK